jgi:hypothetical protein
MHAPELVHPTDVKGTLMLFEGWPSARRAVAAEPQLASAIDATDRTSALWPTRRVLVMCRLMKRVFRTRPWCINASERRAGQLISSGLTSQDELD